MEELTPEERAEELLLMGLRLNRGINKQDFEKQCGLNFDNFINADKLNMLIAEKMLINTNVTIKATDS